MNTNIIENPPEQEVSGGGEEDGELVLPDGGDEETKN